MEQKIQDLKNKICAGSFPTKHKHFGGAGLIISNDEEKPFGESNAVIYTPHAGALSWLLYEMKALFSERLTPSTKHVFYEEIGRTIRDNFKQEGDLIDVMLLVVEQMERMFPEKVVIKYVPF
jgi:hypothetical protein